MNNNKNILLASLLMDAEEKLRMMGYWDQSSPSLEQLASVEPFCIDTMEFYQWVQWIFIPRLRWLIDTESVLPSSCSIAPMAEEWARSKGVSATAFITVLYEIDRYLSD